MGNRLALALRSLRGNLLTATDGRDVLFNSPNGWEVEQPWLWWTGPAGGNGSGGPFGNPIPGANASHTYAAIPAVSRATGLIVDTIATLPWHVYRGDTEQLTTPDWILDPQALRLDGRVVDASNMSESRMSSVDFWAQWILSALWWGDGFVYAPLRDTTGAPKPPMWILHPDDVKIDDGSYWVSDIQLEAGSIIHLRGPGPISNGRCDGVFGRFHNELGMAQQLRSYIAGAFQSGVPAGYLKTSSTNLTQDQADALKSRWMSQHGGSRRSIAVLNATTEFHPLSWTPVDTEAAQFAQLTLTSIAQMFGLPPSMLGGPSGNSLDYTTLELRMRELYTLTLLPWIARIESVLDAQLPRGTEVRIEIDGLLRADTKTRYESYAIGLDKGFLTIDEVRELENRPPLTREEVVV